MFKFLQIQKPLSATSEEWKQWHRVNRSKYPFRYYLTEIFPKRLGFLRLTVIKCFQKVKNCLYYRFYNPTHIVKTTLSNKKWNEFDNRMLYANFQLLVDFIELDCSFVMNSKRTVKPSLWKRLTLGFDAWRDRNAGLSYLDPHIRSGNESDQENEMLDKTDQAHQVLKELYIWWKDIRPTRKDPYDSELWNTCHSNRPPFDTWEYLSPDDENTRQNILAASKESIRLEESYEQEDQEKLELLIKYRAWLWC